MLVRDLRSLRINEKSEDASSIDTATPKEVQKSGEGGLSKVTTPMDNNGSYIDKSMTRQFDHLQLSPNTISDQFESRKTS